MSRLWKQLFSGTFAVTTAGIAVGYGGVSGINQSKEGLEKIAFQIDDTVAGTDNISVSIAMGLESANTYAIYFWRSTLQYTSGVASISSDGAWKNDVRYYWCDEVHPYHAILLTKATKTENVDVDVWGLFRR